MPKRCSVCGQPLSKGMDEAEIQRRMEKIGAAAAHREAEKVRRELDRQYRRRLIEEQEKIRERTLKEAQISSRGEIATLSRQLQEAERKSHREAERAAKETAKQSQHEINLLKERNARERAQHAAETARLKTTVDNLSLKLERQTSEQMGEQGEVDVYKALKAAFPGDDIQRIGRGVRGADILHQVLLDGKQVGRIVYECKNATDWKNEWVMKAKRYRSEYQTPWVMLATRAFPGRRKWFVVERGVPVIDLRLVTKLAEIVRSAVVEIGRLRTSHVGRQAKSEQLFEYILSDHFVGRFRPIADAVGALRDQQSKERQWHTGAWTEQTRLYDEIDDGRREIAARIHSISEAGTKERLKVVGGGR